MIRDSTLLFLLVCIIFSSCGERQEIEQSAVYAYPVQKKYTYSDYVRDYFKKLVNNDSIGKIQITGDSSTTEYFVTYLGILEIDHKKYFVLTQSYSKAENKDEDDEKIGHNEIILLHSNYDMLKTYSAPIDNELPKFIRSNKLIFQNENFSEWIDFENEIPLRICLKNKMCYY